MNEMKFISELHPMLVHFPIAFFMLYAVIEIISVFIKDKTYEKFILILLIGGVIVGMGAVLTGNQAAYQIRHLLLTSDSLSNTFNILDQHENYATISLWFFTIISALRIYLLLKKKFTYKWKIIYIGFALIGCLLIFQTGRLGGELVHKHRINIEKLK